MLVSYRGYGWQDILTGYPRVHCRSEKQICEDHEGYHCDESGEEMRCDHARNVEPRLRVEKFISLEA
jgi:hypothetical protein